MGSSQGTCLRETWSGSSWETLKTCVYLYNAGRSLLGCPGSLHLFRIFLGLSKCYYNCVWPVFGDVSMHDLERTSSEIHDPKGLCSNTCQILGVTEALGQAPQFRVTTPSTSS